MGSARGRTQFAPTVNNIFYSINIASAMLTGRVMWMLVSRNFARQGKASAKHDGVVTYVECDKSTL